MIPSIRNIARFLLLAVLLLACCLVSVAAQAQDFKIVISQYGFGDCDDSAPGWENRPPRQDCDLNKIYNAAVFSSEDFSAVDPSNPSNKNARGPWRSYPSLKVCPDQDGDGRPKCEVNRGLAMVGHRQYESQEGDYSRKVSPWPSFLDRAFLEREENALTYAPDAVRFIGKCSVVMPFIKIMHYFCNGQEVQGPSLCQNGAELKITSESKPVPHRFCNVELAVQGPPTSPLDCNDNDKASNLDDTKNFKIVKIERDKRDRDAAFERRGVKPLPGGYFNPFDSLKITIETDACTSRGEALATEAQLQFGESGKPISIGVLAFTYDAFESRFQRTATLRGSKSIGGPEFAGLLSSNGHFNGGALVSSGDDVGGWFTANDVTPEQAVSHEERLLNFNRLITEMKRVDAGPGKVFSLKLKVPRGDRTYSSLAQSFSLPISLCVPVYGTGPHRVVFSRPVTWLRFAPQKWHSRPIEAAQGFTAEVLDKLSPFKQNKERFSMYADLTALEETYNDSSKTSSVYGKRGCDFESISMFESSYVQLAFAKPLHKQVFMMTPDSSMHFISEPAMYYAVLAHEFGHTFGDLRDEYEVLTPSLIPKWQGKYDYLLGKNCASSKIIEQAFPPPGNVMDPARAICGIKGNYRSTVNSLMNNDWAEDGRAFNVVSCGYLLKAMRGGETYSWWKECAGFEDVYKR